MGRCRCTSRASTSPACGAASAYTGNGMARVDKVEQKTCIDCHMDARARVGRRVRREARARRVAPVPRRSHVDGGDARRRRAAAPHAGEARRRGVDRRRAVAAIAQAGRAIDVVVRNLLVGHRFPGGVLDMQDTWIEVEVADRSGTRIAASGLTHENDPDDDDTHVLRTLVVDDKGRVLERARDGAVPRADRDPDARAARGPGGALLVRRAGDRAAAAHGDRAPAPSQPAARDAQRAACAAAHTLEGAKFLAGARGARDVTLDPCKPQPITLIAADARASLDGTPLDAGEQQYEHGMALDADDRHAPGRSAHGARPPRSPPRPTTAHAR